MTSRRLLQGARWFAISSSESSSSWYSSKAASTTLSAHRERISSACLESAPSISSKSIVSCSISSKAPGTLHSSSSFFSTISLWPSMARSIMPSSARSQCCSAWETSKQSHGSPSWRVGGSPAWASSTPLQPICPSNRAWLARSSARLPKAWLSTASSHILESARSHSRSRLAWNASKSAPRPASVGSGDGAEGEAPASTSSVFKSLPSADEDLRMLSAQSSTTSTHSAAAEAAPARQTRPAAA
mmetsp:Transcript_73810/g.206202  ORF Transcript_73810/g.206202 Transcript_73810/m.206202 type:complete len:244 (-) Transcript_73810:141-872(-)